MGKTTMNIRSRIIEYAIAQAFVSECESLGYRTHWIECTSYRGAIGDFIEMHGNVYLMRPSEEFLARRIESWGFSINIVENSQFLIQRDEFLRQFPKPPILETFYRYMRKSRDILMHDGKPHGGKWNYDHENRSYDPRHIPTWNWKPADTQYIISAKKYFKRESMEIITPVTRSDALSLLQYFLEHHSYDFGRLEDAMYQSDAHVHHSLLSTVMNFGLLHPSEVIEAVLGWHMPLASQEGFIRQILGWREYMRQFYLYYYEDIYTQNTLDHREKLPENWWNYSGEEND